MKTKEQILEDLVEVRKNEQNCGGHMIAGDIFYSDIWRAVKQNCKVGKDLRNRIEQFQWVCEELRKRDFYVHE